MRLCRSGPAILPAISDAHEVRPFARARHDVVDALEVGVHRHVVHALLQIDVTEARRRLRAHAAATGERVSFTAFLVKCLADAIAEDRLLHAYRDLFGRLVLFEDVDVATLIEAERGGVAIPHVLRAAQRRSVVDLHAEIRRVQARPASSTQRSGLLMRLSTYTPGVLRRAFLRALRRVPVRLKQTAGTTLVTSIGMFGVGAGWGVGILPLHTLGLTVGAIAEAPAVVDGRVEPRELLSLTASFDHDVVDGAPAARFAQRLRARIESASALDGLVPSTARS